jgi:hypothetical protein
MSFAEGYAVKLLGWWEVVLTTGVVVGSAATASRTYEIEMSDFEFYSPHIARHAWVDWLLLHDRFNLYHWFGGRGAAFSASFTVRNGTIWRKGTGIGVLVSSRKKRSDDTYDRSLFVSAQSPAACTGPSRTQPV